MDKPVEVPWQDSELGAAKRVANYLALEVGEGCVFEKATLRTIVPNREQVDRRMRDLRKVGWKIRTYRDMASLKPSELFLEKIGDQVWEPGYRWPKEGISAATRRRVFERDGRRCMVCGIDFGDEFPGLPGVVARGTMGHVIPKERGGSLTDIANLRPECQLCNEAAKNLTEMPPDIDLLKRRVGQLGRADKRQLFEWMSSGRRSFSRKEDLWSQYSQLPGSAKEEILESLRESL